MSNQNSLGCSQDLEGNHIQDLGSLHHYRTEIPNIIFQMNLDPWVFKAYCVFKMTAGDRSACFKSNSTLSNEIGCSIPTLIKLKGELAELGLITIQKRHHENGGSLPDLIQIVDIWGQNMECMLKRYPPKPSPIKHSNNDEGDKRDLGGGVNAVNQGSKRGLHKQERYNNKSASANAAPLEKDKDPESPESKELIENIVFYELKLKCDEIIRWIKHYGFKYTKETIGSCVKFRNLKEVTNQVAFVQSALSKNYFGLRQ